MRTVTLLIVSSLLVPPLIVAFLVAWGAQGEGALSPPPWAMPIGYLCVVSALTALGYCVVGVIRRVESKSKSGFLATMFSVLALLMIHMFFLLTALNPKLERPLEFLWLVAPLLAIAGIVTGAIAQRGESKALGTLGIILGAAQLIIMIVIIYRIGTS